MTDARGVRHRWVWATTVALLLGSGACGDSGDDPSPSSTTRATTTTEATTTAPERPVSTTTTAFDPASVEGQVEAAYLKSWDVYAEAVYNLELDEGALAEVFAEASLQTRTEEVADRIAERRAAHVRLDHEYQITIVDSGTASVVDNFVNHQVLIDPVTKQPIEADPNERLLVNFQLKLLEGSWKVTLIQKIGP